MERVLVRIEDIDCNAKTEAFEVLRKEFYPQETAETFIDRNVKFSVSATDFLKTPYVHDFGGDVYSISDEVGIAGATQVKYYKWDLIKPQLYFYPVFNEDNSIKDIYLCPLENIAKSMCGENNIPEVAAELAFYWVRQDMRGKGLGKDLFIQPLDGFTDATTSKSFLFTIAMGNAAGMGVGQILMNFILEKNRIINGLTQNGKIIINGVGASWSEIESLGINSKMFGVREASKATESLAIKYTMKFYGYSKNLSPTFGLIR